MQRTIRSFITGCFYIFNAVCIILYFTLPDLTLHQVYTVPMTLATCFMTLGLLTSDFLTPSLSVISKEILHISDRISGMTLLALGNGIPEITSAYQSMNAGVPSLAIGELIGGVFFLTTVVMGFMGLVRTIYIVEEDQEIAYVNVLNYAKKHYLEDISAMSAMIIIMSVVLWDGRLDAFECIFIMLCYIAHVSFTIYELKHESRQHTDYDMSTELTNDICEIVSNNEPSLNSIQSLADDDENQLVQRNLSRFDEEEEMRRDKIKCQIRGYLTTNYQGGFRMTLRDCLDIWENGDVFTPEKDKEKVVDDTSEEADDESSLLQNGETAASLHNNGTTYGANATTSQNSNLLQVPCRNSQTGSRPGLRRSRSLDFAPVMDTTIPVEEDAINSDNSAPSEDDDNSHQLSSQNSGVSCCSKNRNNSCCYTRGYRLLRYMTAHSPIVMCHFEFFMLLVTTPISAVIHSVLPTPNDTHTFVTEPIANDEKLRVLISPVVMYLLIVKQFPDIISIAIYAFAIGTYFVWSQRHQLQSRIMTRNLVSIMGFLTSICLISAIVDNIVSILQLWTTKFHISESILGITVFAWGNSVGDMVSNITFVKTGIVDIALGACFGSPLLYFLFGVGFDGLLLMMLNFFHIGRHELKSDWAIDLELDSHLQLSTLGVLIAMTIFIVGVPLNGWKIDRRISFWLLLDYFVVTAVNVYIELNI